MSDVNAEESKLAELEAEEAALRGEITKDESVPARPRHVLSDGERERGLVLPHRDAIVHVKRDGDGKITSRCPVTIVRADRAHMHARTPGVLVTERCSACAQTFPATEFVWNGPGDVVVGSDAP